jgi:hypothetical protein
MAAPAAMAASTALPPLSRTANPASEASACGVATSPREARVSGHRVAAVTRAMVAEGGDDSG